MELLTLQKAISNCRLISEVKSRICGMTMILQESQKHGERYMWQLQADLLLSKQKLIFEFQLNLENVLGALIKAECWGSGGKIVHFEPYRLCLVVCSALCFDRYFISRCYSIRAIITRGEEQLRTKPHPILILEWLTHKPINFYWENIQLVTRQHTNVDFNVSLVCEPFIVQKISTVLSKHLFTV